MTQVGLAVILQINQKSLYVLQISVAQKKIRLQSLENVANAPDCDLVYARARTIMNVRIRSIENTMELEYQAMKFNQGYIQKPIDELIVGDFKHWGTGVNRVINSQPR
jgi:hypothetical protein